MTTTKIQAAETVSDIAQDIVERRGDMDDRGICKWAAAYTYWRDAADQLTTDELSEAIHVGRLRVLDADES